MIKLLLSVSFVLLTTTITFAQGDPDDPEIPIDGGISLLLAAGAAYGVKKIRDYRHDKSQE